ncbi:MAG: isoleucine--tRNA ligase [Candidatus Sumerlaeia bacterium]|nr:isoleucine--tRNA ligase [Candidatus Sumerlaeia bacterium]
MRAQLSKREPEILARWQELDLYERLDRRNEGRQRYILHDGPPYANGDIHLGTALNKILKDVIVRYKTMAGFDTHYVPGWDCHGLPIEQRVQNDLGPDILKKSPLEIRLLCEKHAEKYIGIQRDQFKRLGVTGLWQRPYLTMSHEYEVGILEAFREIVARGYVYRGHKPVYWDPIWKTALAEAEVEYQEITSPSIYVRFPVLDADQRPWLQGLKNLSFVIWTTTPWTLPANLAVCLHPDFEYVVAQIGDEHIICAEYLLSGFCEACQLPAPKIVSRHRGAEFEGLHCAHPMIEHKQSLVILGPHVTLEAGTGCVHTAPGHGMEDYLVALKYGLPIFVPVDEDGRFTDDFPMMKGMSVWKANPLIVDHLKEKGLLVGHVPLRHQYPHSWRSHKPIIYRATSQWFMDLSKGVRDRALEAIDREVEWIPAWGRDRIYNMVEMRPEWCLSRQRSWGVPIPAVHCDDCGDATLDLAVIDRLIAIVAREGTNAWFQRPIADFLPDGWACPKCGSRRVEAGKDILDVWFDSGSSHIACLEKDPRLGSPAALYLEGSDQHRGWFQASLLIAIATRDRAPFRTVLTHGFTVDEKGEAMHKSKGNVVDPRDIIKEVGADVLRLWVISEDYRNDIKFSKQILERMSDAYRRIRNTIKFLLGNLWDFNPASDALPYPSLLEMDRWALHELAVLIDRVRKAYDEFEFHKIFHLIHGFCTVEMSAVYLDIVKDRLYCQGPADRERRSAQTVLHEVLDALLRLLAPILVFTTDEAWQYLKRPEPSVHLTDMPAAEAQWRSPDLAARWHRLLDVRSDVSRGLEAVRRTKQIGHSLDAEVHLYPHSDEVRNLLETSRSILDEWFITSGHQILGTPPAEGDGVFRGDHVTVRVVRSPHAKCERCWQHRESVGRNPEGTSLCARCSDVVRRIG